MTEKHIFPMPEAGSGVEEDAEINALIQEIVRDNPVLDVAEVVNLAALAFPNKEECLAGLRALTTLYIDLSEADLCHERPACFLFKYSETFADKHRQNGGLTDAQKRIAKAQGNMQ